MDICKSVPSFELHQLSPLLVSMLKKIENEVGFELSLTSGFRSVAYEVSRGRTGLSSHTLGKAVDVYCYSSSRRFSLISAALKFGFKRIGVYKNFIHLDISDSKDNKPVNVIWYG